MNKRLACLALALGFAPIFGSLRAQEGPPPEQYEPPPPVGVDADMFTAPKSTLSIGMRTLTGPKISFSGSSSIISNANPDADSTTTTRTYNDGSISPSTLTDVNGNPIQPGQTNNWNYTTQSQQIQSNGGGVAMHTYNATTLDNSVHHGNASPGTGFEFTLERDMGWHVGRVQISLIAGLGMNDVHFQQLLRVPAELVTRTDNYSTYVPTIDATSGDVTGYPQGLPPAAPYGGPTTTTDTAGSTIDNSTLINNQPDGPATTSETEVNDEVTQSWRVRGAYFTIKLGPKITLPITQSFRASVSMGPALLYSGTTFTVTQVFTPPTGDPDVNTVGDNSNRLLPAYFADANLEYWLTDTAGFYAGAVMQSSTSYNQNILSSSSDYSTKIDLTSEQGVRMGMEFKF